MHSDGLTYAERLQKVLWCTSTTCHHVTLDIKEPQVITEVKESWNKRSIPKEISNAVTFATNILSIFI
jgi:hypothetical protein